MTREVQFYSIRRKQGEEYNFDIIAVTSTTGTRYNGSREPYHNSTHGKLRDLRGKYGSEAEARNVRDKALQKYEQFSYRVKQAQLELRDATDMRREQVDNLLNELGAVPLNGKTRVD